MSPPDTKRPTSPAQREWATFKRPAIQETYSGEGASSSWEPEERPLRKVNPKDLSHFEQDLLGHHSSRLKAQAAKERRRARTTWYEVRYNDLTKIMALRLEPGTQIPDGLDSIEGEDMIRCAAYHLQARFGPDELAQHLTTWCMHWCENWTDGWSNKGDIIVRVLRTVEGRRRDLTAVELSKVFRLTWKERCKLRIRTIRPFDMTHGEFKKAAAERKKNLNRAREEARRRSEGATPRAEYEATSKTQTKPWKVLGMSRTRYYEEGHHRTGPCLSGKAPDTEHGVVRDGEQSVIDASPRVVGKGSNSPHSTSSTRNSTGNAKGSGGRTTARQEDSALDDALGPFGISTDPSPEAQRAHARRKAA